MGCEVRLTFYSLFSLSQFELLRKEKRKEEKLRGKLGGLRVSSLANVAA